MFTGYPLLTKIPSTIFTVSKREKYFIYKKCFKNSASLLSNCFSEFDDEQANSMNLVSNFKLNIEGILNDIGTLMVCSSTELGSAENSLPIKKVCGNETVQWRHSILTIFTSVCKGCVCVTSISTHFLQFFEKNGKESANRRSDTCWYDVFKERGAISQSKCNSLWRKVSFVKCSFLSVCSQLNFKGTMYKWDRNQCKAKHSISCRTSAV